MSDCGILPAMAQALRKAQSETKSYYQRIRDLVEADRVGAARRLLAEALEKGDHGEDLSGWQRVLAPAKILGVGGERDVDRTPDFQWLREHGSAYQGQWVGLLGGELLAHSASLDEVLALLKEKKTTHPALLHYIGFHSEVPGLSEARTYREKIRLLVEADRVAAARDLLAEALERGDHGEDLSNWQQILAPAKVIRVGGKRDHDRTLDFRWLEEHAEEYRGQWVALLDGNLLAHAGTLDEILVKLEKNPLGSKALLHRIH